MAVAPFDGGTRGKKIFLGNKTLVKIVGLVKT